MGKNLRDENIAGWPQLPHGWVAPVADRLATFTFFVRDAEIAPARLMIDSSLPIAKSVDQDVIVGSNASAEEMATQSNAKRL